MAMDYLSVCERYKVSRERNKKMKTDADRLKLIFKPLNTEKLESLKKQYLVALSQKQSKANQSHQEEPERKASSNAIKLCLSSSDEEMSTASGRHSDSTNDKEEMVDETSSDTDLTSPYMVTGPSSSYHPAVSFSSPSSHLIMPFSTQPLPSTIPLSSTILAPSFSSEHEITPAMSFYTPPVPAVAPLLDLSSLSLVTSTSTVLLPTASTATATSLMTASTVVAPLSAASTVATPLSAHASTATATSMMSASTVVAPLSTASTVAISLPSMTVSIAAPLSTVATPLSAHAPAVAMPFSTTSTSPPAFVTSSDIPLSKPLPQFVTVASAPPFSSQGSTASHASFSPGATTAPTTHLAQLSMIPSDTSSSSDHHENVKINDTNNPPNTDSKSNPTEPLTLHSVDNSSVLAMKDPPIDNATESRDTVQHVAIQQSIPKSKTREEEIRPESEESTSTIESLLLPDNAHKTTVPTVNQVVIAKHSSQDESDNESGSDFWDTPIPQTAQPVPVASHDNLAVNAASKAVSNDDLSSQSDSYIDYSPRNLTMVASSLLHTINAQVRKDHKLARQIYQAPSCSDNMKSHIQHSTVLNSLLTRRAELGKDMLTWDTATLASVFLSTLSEIVSTHGPPSLKNNKEETSHDQEEEGWSFLWPLILVHVRLLFQCGTVLEGIVEILSPILQIDQNTLLKFLQEECGAEEVFSVSSSLVSSLSEQNEENQKHDAYHSLLISSHHSDDLTDSLSEGSAVAVLQSKKTLPSTSEPFGGVKVMENCDGEGDGDEDSLPLPKSPPPQSPSPQSQSQKSLTPSHKQRRSGASIIMDRVALQKRMGYTQEHDEIISSPMSGPSVNSDEDDFDFYQ